MSRGLFLSLDGIDGCGKSTQCKLLADWLRSQSVDVVACVDPGGTEIGDALRDLLLHRRSNMTIECEAMLFMASRAQLAAEIIRPAIEAGKWVVSDRYLLANVVYQGHAGGLDPLVLQKIGMLVTRQLIPELTFVLDLPVEAALRRRKLESDRIESRASDFHDRVRGGFLAEAERSQHIRVIDATPPADVVHAEIRREVEALRQGRKTHDDC